MGISYTIDAEAEIVRLEYSRYATVDDVAATMRAVFRNPDYRPGFGFLADRRRVEPPTLEYVEKVVAFMKAHREKLVGGRWALVFSTRAASNMERLGDTLAAHARDPMLVETFEGIDEAMAWLRETAPAR